MYSGSRSGNNRLTRSKRAVLLFQARHADWYNIYSYIIISCHNKILYWKTVFSSRQKIFHNFRFDLTARFDSFISNLHANVSKIGRYHFWNHRRNLYDIDYITWSMWHGIWIFELFRLVIPRGKSKFEYPGGMPTPPIKKPYDFM